MEEKDNMKNNSTTNKSKKTSVENNIAKTGFKKKEKLGVFTTKKNNITTPEKEESGDLFFKTTKVDHTTKSPRYIEDYFVLGDRKYIKLNSGPTTYFVVDGNINICEQVTIKEDSDTGLREEYKKVKLAYFSISDLVEYPPISEFHNVSMFSFTLTGMDGSKIKIQPSSLDEIVGDLKSRGLFQQGNKATDVLTNTIHALKSNGMCKKENKSPYPGFFVLNKKFVSTKAYVLPTEEQLAEALNIFNDFGEHYTDFAPKLGYIAHWMLMAPFAFAIKQKGTSTKLNNLFLYGTTRTGKSTIAKLACFIWLKSIEQQVISGSHVHSTYQFGRAISKSTYPIIIDEGEGLFNTIELSSLVKTATHATTARSRFNSTLNREEEIMAFSLSIITSNYSKPNDGAISARMDVLNYTSSNIRSREKRSEFQSKFRPDVQEGPLKVLHYIGDYVAAQITTDPSLLDEDWLTLSKRMWKEMYAHADISMPEWMVKIGSPESVEEGFEEEKAHYESNIKALILRNAEPHIPRSDSSLHSTEKQYISPRDKAKDVILNSREPWIYYHNPKSGTDAGKEFVLLEKSIETDLKRDKNIEIRLDRIAELLGGTMQRKIVNGRKKQVAVFKYKDFLDLFG